jgi:hypothetical protein
MSVAAVLSPSNGWKVHTTHANGDCFFKSLQLALRTIGNYYDILDLRHHVAKRVLDPNDLEMNYVIQTWCEIYRAAESSGDIDLIREVQHVGCIAKSNVGNDFSGHERLQLYKSMMSKLYWADENTIRTLERALRLRFLIFDAENNVGFHPVTQKESFPWRHIHYIYTSTEVTTVPSPKTDEWSSCARCYPRKLDGFFKNIYKVHGLLPKVFVLQPRPLRTERGKCGVRGDVLGSRLGADFLPGAVPKHVTQSALRADTQHGRSRPTRSTVASPRMAVQSLGNTKLEMARVIILVYLNKGGRKINKDMRSSH